MLKKHRPEYTVEHTNSQQITGYIMLPQSFFRIVLCVHTLIESQIHFNLHFLEERKQKKMYYMKVYI